MFYVYKWFIKKTNEIFYIGKGTKNRYKQISNRNKLFREIYDNNDCSVEIIEYFDNEENAFNKEYELITYYKSIGQCKCNLDNGGKGGCHFIWTPEMREYYSKYNIMKSIAQRKRMSINNPMKNIVVAKKVGEKHSKPFYIGNKLFQNLEEAGEQYKCSMQTIKYWLSVGHNKNELCYYKDEKPKQYDFSKNNHITNNIKIIYDNKRYNSLKELAICLNIKYTTLHKYFKSNKPINNKIIELWQGNQQPSEEKPIKVSSTAQRLMGEDGN